MVEEGATPGWSLFSRRNNRIRLGTVCLTKRKKKAACGRTGKLMTVDKEKAEGLDEFSASVFTGNLSSHTS